MNRFFIVSNEKFSDNLGPHTHDVINAINTIKKMKTPNDDAESSSKPELNVNARTPVCETWFPAKSVIINSY